jgi:hypothetical protein
VSQARFQKQQREKARREKAAAKFARKEERKSGAVERGATVADGEAEAQVLGDLAALHERFGNEELSFEEFMEAKEQIMERLDVR